MPEFSDIYVISKKRRVDEITKFLDEFLISREESADEYEVPQYADSPKELFKKVDPILKLAETDSTFEYRVYWRASDGTKPEHAMVFYLKDGQVIYGLSTDVADNVFAKDLLARLKAFLGSGLGYIGHEASPDAETFEEFQKEMEKHVDIE